jgi:hypothetical protein
MLRSIRLTYCRQTHNNDRVQPLMQQRNQKLKTKPRNWTCLQLADLRRGQAELASHTTHKGSARTNKAD